jgi:hypothetical protein
VHDLYNWLRENTSPGTVVLCPPSLAAYTVAASGRGVVSLPMNHSNPYVSFVQRDTDRQLMYGALRDGEVSLFLKLARKYRVEYVAFERETSSTSVSHLLREIGSFGRIRLAAIVWPPGSG